MQSSREWQKEELGWKLKRKAGQKGMTVLTGHPWEAAVRVSAARGNLSSKAHHGISSLIHKLVAQLGSKQYRCCYLQSGREQFSRKQHRPGQRFRAPNFQAINTLHSACRFADCVPWSCRRLFWGGFFGRGVGSRNPSSSLFSGSTDVQLWLQPNPKYVTKTSVIGSTWNQISKNLTFIASPDCVHLN